MSKLYSGNCVEILKTFQEESIDLIVTDPPYLINYQTNYRKDKDHRFCSPIQNDKDAHLLISESIKEMYRVLKNDTAVYMFCSFDFVDFFKQEVEKYFNLKNIIIWAKNNWTAGDLEAQYGKAYEMIVYANKGRCKLKSDKRESDVWDYKRVVGNRQYHQNQKPVELLERCIRNSSIKGGVVLDPFMGSGSTCVAAQNIGRQYIGIELEEVYIDIAKQRLAQKTLFSV